MVLLADFHDAEEALRWRPTDDVVMGGVSSSAMRAGDGTGTFSGELSLDRGGGFASVRRREEVVDLSGYDAIDLRVRGLLISDRQAGPFRLEVASIAATSNRGPPSGGEATRHLR